MNETLDYSSQGYNLHVVGTLNINTRIVTFTIVANSLDGNPLPPNVGFLPPNTDGSSGEGFFTYTIKAKSTTVTGELIASQARIVFDQEEPINTAVI